MDNELINTVALARLSYFHLNVMVGLYRRMGSATAIVEQRSELPRMFPSMPARIVQELASFDIMRGRAEEELAWAADHNVQVLCLNDPLYPRRLKETPDAPLALFYRGTADLNARRVINVVGTRHCTPYGEDLIRRFVADLRRCCPDTLIVSGLAYGVDIHAHRYALANQMDTVAVLAHGLDTLYPQRHRDTANEMVAHGGLVTEYMTHTQPDKVNFVRRNRIVAGMSDATILVESAAKGGGLITCSLANSYNRDVFAFPGRIGDSLSEGCNKIIRNRSAQMVISAESFVSDMGWETDAQLATAQKNGIERSLFPEVEGDAKTIIDALAKNNDQQMNVLTVSTGLPINRLTALLFELEMKGMVKALAGGMYHLIS